MSAPPPRLRYRAKVLSTHQTVDASMLSEHGQLLKVQHYAQPNHRAVGGKVRLSPLHSP
jgi:hypothetical protein